MSPFGLLLLGVQSLFLSVSNKQFYFNNKQIFLSGVNQAWNTYAQDFGNGKGAANLAALTSTLQNIASNGGNTVRIWLHIDGSNTPQFDSNGNCIGMDPGGTLVNDLKNYLQAAQQNNIFVILVLWNGALNTGPVGGIIYDGTKLQTYLDNALTPLVTALKDQPALAAWEIMNEPEGSVWAGQSDSNPCFDTSILSGTGAGWTGGYWTMPHILRLVNWHAAAIHAADPKALVTLGSWSQYASTSSYSGMRNYYTDACLLAGGGKTGGTLDFYQVHTYDYNGAYGSNAPFTVSASGYGLDKPLIIGEFAAAAGAGMSSTQQYTYAVNHGYNGALAWQVAGGTQSDSTSTMYTGVSSIRTLINSFSFSETGTGGTTPTIAPTSPTASGGTSTTSAPTRAPTTSGSGVSNGLFLGISNKKFMFNGKTMFLSGANQAWNNYANDFGNGKGAANLAALTSALQQVSDNGGNSMRMWVHVDGSNTPTWDSNGGVSAMDNSGTLVSDLRAYLQAAKQRNIFVTLVLWNGALQKAEVSGLVTVDSKLQSYIDNVLTPLVTALKDEPALAAWEIMNEPEGGVIPSTTDSNPCFDTNVLAGSGAGWTGAQWLMQRVLRFVNWQAAAIHQADPKALVTVGSWCEKPQSSAFSGMRNYYSDSCLLAAGGKSGGNLDFYQMHTYDNGGSYNTNAPFKVTASAYALDKPLVIGEFSAAAGAGMSTQQQYAYAVNNGYNGAWAWQFAGGSSSDSSTTFLSGVNSVKSSLATFSFSETAGTGAPTLSPTTIKLTSSPTRIPTTSPTTPSPTRTQTTSPTTPSPTRAQTTSPTTPGPTRTQTTSPTTPSPTRTQTTSPTTPSPTRIQTTSPTLSPTHIQTTSPTTTKLTPSPTRSQTPTSAPTLKPPTSAPTPRALNSPAPTSSTLTSPAPTSSTLTSPAPTSSTLTSLAPTSGSTLSTQAPIGVNPSPTLAPTISGSKPTSSPSVSSSTSTLSPSSKTAGPKKGSAATAHSFVAAVITIVGLMVALA